jgi:hypothetical protein
MILNNTHVPFVKALAICQLAAAVFTGHAGAQNLTSSPYSRFGIGDLLNRSTGRGQAMGGLSCGLPSSKNLNLLNPASLAGMDTMNFILELGGYDKITDLRTTGLHKTLNNVGVSYLAMAFPVTKWWKAGVGVMPFSNVAYNFSVSEKNALMGNVISRFAGTGGTSQFLISQAVTPVKFRYNKKIDPVSLSVGLNFTYLFGPISHTRSLEIPADSLYFSTYSKRTAILGDIDLSYGAQLHIPLPGNYFFTAGGIYRSSSDIRTESRTLVTSTGTGFIDTLLYDEDPDNSVVLPQGWGAGFTFGKTNKFTAGVEYRIQDWSKASFVGQPDSMATSRDFIAGVEYTPNLNSLTSYLQKVRYRAGFRYSETYLQLNGYQLNEFGITFGAGFPIQDRIRRGTQSSLNVTLELGKRGTVSNELIREMYGILTLQLTLHDRWFEKRYYD